MLATLLAAVGRRVRFGHGKPARTVAALRGALSAAGLG